MKYLRIILLFSAMLAATFAANAQRYGVTVSEQRATVAGGMVNVSMKIDAEKLDIGCNGSYRLVPFIGKDSVRVQLPEVVYSGGERHRFDRRREHLSGMAVTGIYKEFPKANKRTSEQVDYDVAVPYMAWMDGARVGYDLISRACDGDKTLVSEYMPEAMEGARYRRLPDPMLYADVVFYSPEPENYRDPFTQKMVSGKRRSVSADLYVNFPQDVPEILPYYMNNAVELHKADSLMGYIFNNDLTSGAVITITGYASPEGALWRNANLARYRSQNMHKYLSGKYDLSGIPVTANSVPVDWEGLRRAVESGTMSYADDILNIIDEVEGDEQRERLIARVADGIPHKWLLNNVYPRLRRTELKVDFTVRGITLEKAKEMLYSKPELLSMEEMYMVAGEYEAGTPEYAEVFAIAAKHFPGDFTANNNAAAAYLQMGDAENAYRYVVKVAHDPRAYSNVGTYYYLLGDMEQAGKYFRMAVGENIPGAAQRLKMIEDK